MACLARAWTTVESPLALGERLASRPGPGWVAPGDGADGAGPGESAMVTRRGPPRLERKRTGPPAWWVGPRRARAAEGPWVGKPRRRPALMRPAGITTLCPRLGWPRQTWRRRR